MRDAAVILPACQASAHGIASNSAREGFAKFLFIGEMSLALRSTVKLVCTLFLMDTMLCGERRSCTS
jgi:hypothetical protein